jgi:putative ABC transport system substrate-binding protein
VRRREVTVGLIAASLAAPVAAQHRPRISILHSGFPRRTPIERLFEALAEYGYRDGETVTLELLGGEGDPDRLSLLVAQLTQERPNVIIALTSPAVLALKRAAVTTPVVFAFVSDPVALGIVESLARPGGNYTGITYSEAELGGKRLELVVDAVPGITTVAVLFGAFPENAALLASIRRSASRRNLIVFERQIGGIGDLRPAFDDAVRAGAQGAIFMTDNLLFGHRKEVSEQALAHKLPSIHSFGVEATDGGLMSFGPDIEENYRRAAALAARVARGARTSDLPVEEPTRFVFRINLNTAKALGLTIPPTLLARADEVIE